MDYYHNHTHRETLGDLPFLSASSFVDDSVDTSGWLGRWHLRGRPYDLERLQHLLHEQGRKDDGTDKYDLDVGGYRDRCGYSQVPLHVEDQNSITLVSKYTPRFRQGIKDSHIPYDAAILPRWEAFANSVGGRKELEGIQIDNIALPPSPFLEKKLLPALSKNTNLLSLELSNCELDADGLKFIARYLQKNKVLATLDLSGNEFKDVRTTKSLASAMKNHTELSFVNLSKCKLGGNVDLLVAVLSGCIRLKSLVLDYNGINSKEGVVAVAKFIANNNTLTLFSMHKNAMGDENAKALGDALQKNTKIRELCLSGTKLNLPSIIASKDVTKNLTHLDLSSKWWSDESHFSNEIRQFGRSSQNKLKIPGVKVIAKFLKSNPALVELNLACTGIPSKAATQFASALKRNTNLQHLNLGHNSFNNNSVPSFVDALRNNTTLLTLDLSGNNINVTSGRVNLLRGALCDVSSLESIAASNHTCAVTMVEGGKSYRNSITNEIELRKINLLDVTEGEKIRLKVVFAMFTLEIEDLFDPRSFDEVPLELMPRLLEMVQQEIGFKGYGKAVSKRKTRGKYVDPTLDRLCTVFTQWNTPLLVQRGPGKLRRKKPTKKKRSRKRKFGDDEDDSCDEDWSMNNRGAGF